MSATTTIAFQGERGAFSEQAARYFFSRKPIVTVPVQSFSEVFRTVSKQSVDYGIVPIENSLNGSIFETYDLLNRFRLRVTGEIKLRIVHVLMTNRGVRLKDIDSIYSHPQALAQCNAFLGSIPRARPVPYYDTAGAARYIKSERLMGAAAIAGTTAAKVYGLKILRTGIENDHRNYTRFLILSRKPVRHRSASKISVMFSLNNEPGALFHALSVFALRSIDLYKIESRPIIGKPWEYLFYLDFSGNLHASPVQRALRHLREITTSMKILGSYPIGKIVGRVTK